MTTTKFHPILFSTPMIQAILENRKTQTRRVIKLPNYHPSAVEKQKDKMTIKDWILYDGNQEVMYLHKTSNETAIPLNYALAQNKC